jgi:hypothetical protein
LRPVLIEARSDGDWAGVAARSDEGGSFVLKGLLPGHYRLQVRAVNPEGASRAVSARLGEKEVLREGFDVDGPAAGSLVIALGSGSSGAPTFRASGTLLDAGGRPVSGARLMLVSTGHPVTQVWAETDSKGRFSVAAAVGGEYRILVAPDQGQTELLSACDFIEAHRGDYPPVQLVEGQGAVYTLKRQAMVDGR